MGATRWLGRFRGMLAATWHYATRQFRPVRRISPASPAESEADPDRSVAGDAHRIQRRREGHGPVYRRSYQVRILRALLSPDELMAQLVRNLNFASPVEVAEFAKTSGSR